MKQGRVHALAGLLLVSLAMAATSLRAESSNPVSPELREQGRALFQAQGCFQCHSLADADANGAYAPSFDNNPRLNRAFVIGTLAAGRGDMPSFGGLMSEAEIARLADYLIAVSSRDGTP